MKNLSFNERVMRAGEPQNWGPKLVSLVGKFWGWRAAGPAILILGLFWFTPVASAQELSFGIYPPIIQVNANPPASITTPMAIQNFSDKEVTVGVYYRFFKPLPTGAIELLPTNATQGEDKDIFDKVQLLSGSSVIKKITLAPKQKKQLSLHIGIPQNEPPSDYYFSVLFISSQPGVSEINAAQSSSGISTNVLLSIGPKGETKGNVSFSSPNFVSHGSVPLTLRVSNTSDHFISIKGNVVVKNMFGDIVGNIDLLPANVLEGSERIIPAKSDYSNVSDPRIFWREKVLLGFYTATATVSLSESGPVFTKQVHFVAFPYEVLFGIIISLGIVGFAWKRAQNRSY